MKKKKPIILSETVPLIQQHLHTLMQLLQLCTFMCLQPTNKHREEEKEEDKTQHAVLMLVASNCAAPW